MSVSIHAPTGGATKVAEKQGNVARVSIHAPTGGATAPPPLISTENTGFQSTRPRGARPMCCMRGNHYRRFNPRAHGGRDVGGGGGERRYQVSIHAPTGGATYALCQAASWFHRFNPRAHGGRDPTDSCGSIALFVSIHAPTGGATSRCAATHEMRLFQSTRPRGARRTTQNFLFQCCFFHFFREPFLSALENRFSCQRTLKIGE